MTRVNLEHREAFPTDRVSGGDVNYAGLNYTGNKLRRYNADNISTTISNLTNVVITDKCLIRVNK